MSDLPREALAPGDRVTVSYMFGDVLKRLTATVARFSPIEPLEERGGFWTPAGVWVGVPRDATVDLEGCPHD